MMMMMTFITQRGESQGKTKKERKATKSKGRGLEEGGLDARSCASTGRKDVVREVKGIEKMSMLGAFITQRGESPLKCP